jgi:hypothetical protein
MIHMQTKICRPQVQENIYIPTSKNANKDIFSILKHTLIDINL